MERNCRSTVYVPIPENRLPTNLTPPIFIKTFRSHHTAIHKVLFPAKCEDLKRKAENGELDDQQPPSKKSKIQQKMFGIFGNQLSYKGDKFSELLNNH